MRRPLRLFMFVCVVVATLLPACSKPKYEMTAADHQAMEKAIQDDKPIIVQSYLKKGMDPNAKGADGVPYLVKAAQLQQTDILRAIITAHANVDVAAPDGSTALTVGAEKGFADVVRFALDWGANPNTALTSGPNAGATPLILASAHGYKEVLQALFDKGAKLDLKDAKGQTALTAATQNGHADAAELLRSRGAKD